MFGVHLGNRLLLAGGLAVITGGVVATSTIAPALTASPASTTAQSSNANGTGQQHDRHNQRNRIVRAIARDAVKDTAKETGLTEAQVKADLKQGESLDTIAGDKSGAVQADLLSDLKAQLDKLVSQGKITQDRENTIMGKAPAMIQKLMARTWHSHGSSQNSGNSSSSAAPTTAQ